jgi:hypothetical protein
MKPKLGRRTEELPMTSNVENTFAKNPKSSQRSRAQREEE